MNFAKRTALIERLKQIGLPSYPNPNPLATLEEFFEGNDFDGSIGCNLNPPPPASFFYEKLKEIRSKPGVQDVLVEVKEVEEGDESMWPFTDVVYVFAAASPDEVSAWSKPLQVDSVSEGYFDAVPINAPKLKPGVHVNCLWWD